jgi:hypothetical protein
MTGTEDRLRTTLNGIASEITPNSAPPLDLRGRGFWSARAAFDAGNGRRNPARSRRWLAPVAAAVSVALLATAALVSASLTAGHRPPPAGGLSAGHVPPYYVALRSLAPVGVGPDRPYAAPSVAVVRATATGATIATIKPPAPYFTFVAVSGEADDRTFVLAATHSARYPVSMTDFPETGFYRLTIDPAAATAAGRATLTALPVRLSKGTVLDGMAITQTGTKLAVTSTNWRQVGLIASELHVFDLATGAERTWRGQAYGVFMTIAQGFVSWAADDRTLTLIGTGTRGNDYRLLVLDTARPGNDLLADSKVISVPGLTARHREPPVSWRAALITPNGGTVVVVLEIAADGQKVYQRLEKISVRTGKPISTLSNTTAGLYDQVLWASPTGHVLVVMTGLRHHGTGIYTGTRFTPIPWPAGTVTAAW